MPTLDLRHVVLESVARARALDPLNAWVMAIEAFCLALTDRAAEAPAAAERAVALDDQNFTARWTLLWTLAACERHDEALAAAEPALSMSNRHPRVLVEVAAIHAVRGDLDGAEAVYRELRSRARTSYMGFAEQAVAAAAAGHQDEARALIKQAVAAHETFLAFWKLPSWRPLWKDEEAARILRATDLMRLSATGPTFHN